MSRTKKIYKYVNRMKKVVLLIILFILLSGCSEIRYAKAREISAETRRKNERHQADMAERNALMSTHIAAKGNLIWSGMIGGIIFIFALAISGSFYVVGFSIAKVKQAGLLLIPLDEKTRQYPLIIAGSKKSHNPNTLSVSNVWKNSLPYQEALRASTAVQMIGTGEPRYKSYKEYEQELLLE